MNQALSWHRVFTLISFIILLLALLTLGLKEYYIGIALLLLSGIFYSAAAISPNYSHEWDEHQARIYLRFATRLHALLLDNQMNKFNTSFFDLDLFPNEKLILRDMLRNSQDLISKHGGRYSNEDIEFWEAVPRRAKEDYLNEVIKIANLKTKDKWS